MSSKRQEKRKQRETFNPSTTESNPAATFAVAKRKASTDAEQSSSKKQTISKAIMKNALEQQFHNYIYAEIAASTNTKDTFNRLCSLKTMPRVVIQAEDAINAKRGAITIYLKSQKESNVNMFIAYVKKYFNAIEIEVQKPSAEPTAGPSTEAPSPSASSSTSTTTTASTALNDDNEDENLRSCSTSYLSIIREDTTAEAQQHINSTLENAINRATDYTIEFASQVHQLMLLFQTRTFRLSNNEVTLPVVPGVSSNDLLPVGVLEEEISLPPAFNKDILTNASKQHQAEFRQLFTMKHFARIHSSYFGELGSKTTSRYHDAMVEALPKTDVNAEASRDLSSHVMQKAYSKYYTNFENMWNEDRFSELLDRLLLHILNAHCVTKAKRKKDEIPKPVIAPKQPQGQFTFGNKSRGTIQKIIEKEEKNRQIHLAKGREDKAAACQKRIVTYNEAKQREKEQRMQAHEDMCTLQQSTSVTVSATGSTKSKALEHVLDDDVPDDESITKTRVQDLKTLAKKLLWEDKKVVSDKLMSTLLPGITQNERNVMAKIVTGLKPYIPLGKQRGAFIFKLPLVLLANTLLGAMGKERAKTKITPQSSCTRVNSLFVDTETIFSLFCAWHGKSKVTRRMHIMDFQGNPITSAHQALDHKDAVFGAFFDIGKIHDICKSHGLTFANVMHVLPGCKTVRLLGVRGSITTSSINPTAKPAYTPLSSGDQHKAVALKADITATQRQLQIHRKELAQFRLSTSPRHLKRRYNRTQEAWVEINKAKQTVRNLEFQIADARRIIQLRRQEMSALRRVPTTIQRVTIPKGEACCRLATQSLLNLEDLKDATFCGVDNGLVAVTETVAFDLTDFYYHIDLHNKARGLPCNETTEFRKPPKSFKITPGECKQGYGINDFAKYISRNQPKELQRAHKRLNELPLNIQSLEDYQAHYAVHKTTGLALRSYHYSKTMIKKRRRLSMRVTRFKHKVCYRERQRCSKKVPPIMFIGDRGFGIGSKIKRYARFGGSWMAAEHGRCAQVFITNEYNSSQTCLYCFGKLSHTLKKKDGKLVQNRGSFICYNPECVGRYRVMARDRVSALAIGLAGLSQVLFGVTIPEFDPEPSAAKSSDFNKKAISFCRNFNA